VILITAQRLARRLCSCKQPLEFDEDALLRTGFYESDLDGTWKPFRPVGCDHCGGSGYKGRVGIYQVMPVTEQIGRIIMEDGNAMQIAEQARKEGIPDLRQSGLKKVKDGVTSLEEINRVTID
jgi:type IV pilus assembly protein PilB